MQWEVSLLRLTAFPAGTGTVEPGKWWSDVVQKDPDSIQMQPKLNIAEFQGEYGPGKLALRLVPGRIEWLYNRPDELGLPTSLGAFDESLALFSVLVEHRFRVVGPLEIARLALGAILTVPVESREAGYAILGPQLPSVKLDPGSTDFAYQINRPCPVDVSGHHLTINRLSKWSVVKHVASRGVVNNDLTLFDFSESTRLNAQVELDINTAETEGPELTPIGLSAVFAHLSKLALDVAERGDVA